MRVLVADDHKLIRDGLRPFLAELDTAVEVFDAASLDEAMRVVENTDGLNLILLDVMMPGMNGLEGLHALKKKCPDIPIVMLSGYSSREHVGAAVQAGAAGFIPKTVSGGAMVNALRLVLSGEVYLPSSSFFDESARQNPTQPKADGTPAPFDKLSRREAEILLLLVEGRTNKEIAIALDLQEITIKVHLRNVYRKIGAANRAQAVRISLSSGWGPAVALAKLPT